LYREQIISQGEIPASLCPTFSIRMIAETARGTDVVRASFRSGEKENAMVE
jgi:hypothetical protein